VRHALVHLLGRGRLRDPDLRDVSITVSEVRMTPDLKSAIAFVLPLGGTNVETVVAALNRAAPHLQGQVGRHLKLRFAPKLKFVADTSFEAASRIESALRRQDRDDRGE
jgi:ribosome-binding factor A